MYIDGNKVKNEIITSKGVSQLTIQTAIGKRAYTWYAQHSAYIYKDDSKINHNGCASCATLAAANTFSDTYDGAVPYAFRTNYQQKIIGNMEMPWNCYACQKVLEAAGLHTDYHHQTSVTETYKLIREHLLKGMPVVTWVWFKDIDGNVDKRYTNYAHVILLSGVTEDDKAVILDSGSYGPLRVMDLMDVCRHCLPGNWLNGFILVYPKLYRVRKTWSDAESQIGAYVNLDNAKAAVEEARKTGGNYTVYNSSGMPVWPFYRVRKSWDDEDSQIGAFTYYKNATFLSDLNEGYNVYDNWGIMLHQGQLPELPVIVSLKAWAKIYEEPAGSVVRDIESAGKFTITEIVTEGITYGRLKSGAGWVSLMYATRPE